MDGRRSRWCQCSGERADHVCLARPPLHCGHSATSTSAGAPEQPAVLLVLVATTVRTSSTGHRRKMCAMCTRYGQAADRAQHCRVRPCLVGTNEQPAAE